jgi:hypothetical protein
MQATAMASEPFSAAAVADFLRSQGRNVVEGADCWWYNAYGQNRVFYSFPPHKLVTPSSDHLSRLFKSLPQAKALRYLSPNDEKGKASYIWVCRSPYELERLSSNTRSKVRRGLKHCHVRSLSFDELDQYGAKAQDDTLKRLRLESPASVKPGKGLHECPAYEAWGAFVGDQLAAYVITLRIDDWVYIQVNRSVTEFLKLYSNNALVYTVVRELLSRPGVTTLSYGWEPLYEVESLDQFKSSLGFVRQPVKQCVALAPWLRPLLNPLVCRVVEQIALLRKSNRRLQWLAGICRLARGTPR